MMSSCTSAARGLWKCALVLLALLVAGRASAQTLTISSPASGAVLPAGSAAFSWTIPAGVTDVWLLVGSAQGQADLCNSGDLGMATSYTVSGLPSDGRQVWVRAMSNTGGTWTYTDATYTAAAAATVATAPTLNPPTGSTLSGSSVTFSWASSTPLISSWLYVGTSVGQFDLFNSNALGAATSVTVNTLPTTGATIYVRLWYQTTNGWASSDATYVTSALTTTTATAVALTSPAPGSALPVGPVTFTWTQPAGVLGNALSVGSRPGRSDLYRPTSEAVATSATVPSLPMDGRTVYVRLWYLTSAGWAHLDTTYTTSAVTASIVSPAQGSILPEQGVTFTWTASPQITAFELVVDRLGRLPRTRDRRQRPLFNSGQLGAGTTSVAVGSLPAGTVEVQLWYQTPSGWNRRDYVYRAQSEDATAGLNLTQ